MSRPGSTSPAPGAQSIRNPHHSHIGLSASAAPSHPSHNAFAGHESSAARGTNDSNRFRASVDAAAGRGWTQNPNLNQTFRNNRPASELLKSTKNFSGNNSNNQQESEAIDRWFQDLQHYEQTLEEMAAASLDANFKEELSAIEQWFKVLSEAERTAALYSLLQTSSQVQMRFFVTVLQQMAKQDPMTALLSPANPQQVSLEAQMEAKLNSLGLKAPPSPAVRQFARQSLGQSYLSPNSASLPISEEPSQPHTPVNVPNVPNIPLNVPRTPTNPTSNEFDNQLSPLMGGSWASMVNTPLVPMFDNSTSAFDSNRLSSPNLSENLPNFNSVVLENDVRKFRRSARISQTGNQQNFNSLGQQTERTPLSARTPNSPGNAQQTAVNAQQNWRNNLNSPAEAAQAQLANLIQLQQQIYQQQQFQQLLQSQQFLSPGQNRLTGIGIGLQNNFPSPNPRRSPRPGDRSPNLSTGYNKSTTPAVVAGSGVNPDEDLDMNLLNDVSQWLKALRLHKYTPNLSHFNWKDLVKLTDADLEQLGVSAKGARTKLEKVFAVVREKTNMGENLGEGPNSV